jgi:hypothetical protein
VAETNEFRLEAPGGGDLFHLRRSAYAGQSCGRMISRPRSRYPNGSALAPTCTDRKKKPIDLRYNQQYRNNAIEGFRPKARGPIRAHPCADKASGQQIHDDRPMRPGKRDCGRSEWQRRCDHDQAGSLMPQFILKRADIRHADARSQLEIVYEMAFADDAAGCTPIIYDGNTADAWLHDFLQLVRRRCGHHPKYDTGFRLYVGSQFRAKQKRPDRLGIGRIKGSDASVRLCYLQRGI